jgi:Transglutaminase-like superfamily
MRRLLPTAFLLALLGTTIGIVWPGDARSAAPESSGPKSSYVLVVTGAKRVHDELTFEFAAPRVRADDWDVFVSQLPELAGQTMVRSNLMPGGRKGRELSALGRPLLYTRVPVQGSKWRQGLTVRVEYEATLFERHLERRPPEPPEPPAIAPPAPQERRSALAWGHQFDFTASAFQDWLDGQSLRRAPEEEDVDFARRAFIRIKHGFQPGSGAAEKWRASRVCKAGKSDPGGLAILFVSTLRANGVAARVLSGRWAFPSKPGANAADEPHIKAEFFAEGVGWVPADIGSAVVLDRKGQGLDYFGKDEADFLTMHVDTDIEFETTHFGRKTLTWIQAPSFWVNGAGSLDGVRTAALSKITTEPLDPSAQPGKHAGKVTRSATATKGPKPVALAADQAASQQGVTVSGIVTDRRDNWLMLRADGEQDPVKYLIPPDPGKRMLLDLQGIFSVGRVRIVYELKDDSRQLISITKVVLKTVGTVTGEVLHIYDWWVEVKPRGGPPEGYALQFMADKNHEMVNKLKSLKVGDNVTIKFMTDFERHRIETLEKQETKKK